MSSSPLSPLSALSPLDGRYAAKTDKLRPILSEAGFMHHRVKVEIAWLQALSQAGFADMPFSADAKPRCSTRWSRDFTEADAARIKEIEAVTNHDVKAVEYWLKEQVKDVPELVAATEFIHFACTSEDINNTSHGMMLKAARDGVMLPALRRVHRAPDARSRTTTPTCRCCRAPTARPPARPRWARKSPTSSRACSAPSSASPASKSWAR